MISGAAILFICAGVQVSGGGVWQATALPIPPTDRHAPDSMALIPDWNLIGPGLVLKWFNVVKETLLAAFRAPFGLWPIQIGPTESAHHPSAITALASLCPLEQTGLAANIASNTTAVRHVIIAPVSGIFEVGLDSVTSLNFT